MNRKVVLDTNLYIDWMNQGLFPEWFQSIAHLRYLNGVVLMELEVGTVSQKSQKALQKLVRAYRTANRIVTPSDRDFEKAGQILRQLRLRKRFDSKKTMALTHDVLIAVSTKQIGATVVTQNRKDFEAIKTVFDFRCEIV